MNVLAPVELGGGRVAEFVYEPGGRIPYGLKLSHGDCSTLLVRWSAWPGNPERPAFTLESLTPLSIGETIRCPKCDEQGRIQSDSWWVKDE